MRSLFLSLFLVLSISITAEAQIQRIVMRLLFRALVREGIGEIIDGQRTKDRNAKTVGYIYVLNEMGKDVRISLDGQMVGGVLVRGTTNLITLVQPRNGMKLNIYKKNGKKLLETVYVNFDNSLNARISLIKDYQLADYRNVVTFGFQPFVANNLEIPSFSRTQQEFFPFQKTPDQLSLKDSWKSKSYNFETNILLPGVSWGIGKHIKQEASFYFGWSQYESLLANAHPIYTRLNYENIGYTEDYKQIQNISNTRMFDSASRIGVTLQTSISKYFYISATSGLRLESSRYLDYDLNHLSNQVIKVDQSNIASVNETNERAWFISPKVGFGTHWLRLTGSLMINYNMFNKSHLSYNNQVVTSINQRYQFFDYNIPRKVIDYNIGFEYNIPLD